MGPFLPAGASDLGSKKKDMKGLSGGHIAECRGIMEKQITWMVDLQDFGPGRAHPRYEQMISCSPLYTIHFHRPLQCFEYTYIASE